MPESKLRWTAAVSITVLCRSSTYLTTAVAVVFYYSLTAPNTSSKDVMPFAAL